MKIIYVVVVYIYVGMAEESSTSDYMNDEAVSVVVVAKKPNKSSIILVSLAVLVSVVAIVVLSILVYKRWQRKKREAQQARLMKLFEPDEQLDEELSGNNIV